MMLLATNMTNNNTIVKLELIREDLSTRTALLQ